MVLKLCKFEPENTFLSWLCDWCGSPSQMARRPPHQMSSSSPAQGKILLPEHWRFHVSRVYPGAHTVALNHSSGVLGGSF